MSDKNDKNEQLAIGLLMVLAMAGLYALLLRTVPQILYGGGLGLVGALGAVGAARGLGFGLDWYREVGLRLGAAGLFTATVFLLVRDLIGADVQMRRFSRAWDLDRSLHTLGHYPLAVIPLGFAAALVVAGVLIYMAGSK